MNRNVQRARREEALHAWLDARDEYEASLNHTEDAPPWGERELAALAEADRHWARMAQAERDYFAQLPPVAMSVCPFCGQELARSFDPFRFDGPWWRPDDVPEEPRPCPHFNVLRGAVSYGDRRPMAAYFEVRPGPEVPYVIPALLEHESMTAVIGRLEMHNGYTAYPIAYFADGRLPPEQLTADWPRSLYSYTTQRGEDRWRIPAERWDFDLAPWVAAGRVRWCPPESGNTKLNPDSGEPCPYAGLPGRRRQIVVYRDLVSTWQPPNQAAVWPVRPLPPATAR